MGINSVNYEGIQKIIISATLELTSGLHIGSSSDLYGIGAVDSVVIRDPLTKQPIIPGSSLKGKIRKMVSLKHRHLTNRMFGSVCSNKTENNIESRFQFCDCFLTKKSKEKLEKVSGNLFMTEIKFENNIDSNLKANPRQIERVPRGAEFDFKLIYTVLDNSHVNEDMNAMIEGLKLLCLDYLGGNGSRGYGKVKFKNFNVNQFSSNNTDLEPNCLVEKFKAVEKFDIYNEVGE